MITSKADLATYKEKIKAINGLYYAANAEKINTRRTSYRKANPGKINAYHAAWRKSHPEKIKAKDKAYKEANVEKMKSWRKAHYESNRAKYRARGIARENRIAQQTPVWADIKKMEDIYRRARESGMHVDHYFPIKGKTVCGLHVEDNLQLLTPYENLRKGNRMPRPYGT